jgi:hypothetical protein
MTNKCHELCVAFKRMTANPVKNPSLRIGKDRESNAAFGRIFGSGDLSQKWLSKIGLADKWRTCSDGRQKRPRKESRNEKAQKEPYGGIQGESGRGRVERRQNVG